MFKCIIYIYFRLFPDISTICVRKLAFCFYYDFLSIEHVFSFLYIKLFLKSLRIITSSNIFCFFTARLASGECNLELYGSAIFKKWHFWHSFTQKYLFCQLLQGAASDYWGLISFELFLALLLVCRVGVQLFLAFRKGARVISLRYLNMVDCISKQKFFQVAHM